MQELEQRLLIDPQEGDFMHLNHFLKHSSEMTQAEKQWVKKLTMEVQQDSAGSSSECLPEFEEWATTPHKVRLRPELRQKIADEITEVAMCRHVLCAMKRSLSHLRNILFTYLKNKTIYLIKRQKCETHSKPAC